MATETFYCNLYSNNNKTITLSGKYTTLKETEKEKHDSDFAAVEITLLDGNIADISVKKKYRLP